MINSTHLKNIERKIQDYNANLLMFEQQFVIVPYLASGYIDYSNYGQVDGQRIIDNFETYKRLWTGNDSFNINWKDSVSFTNTIEDNDIKVNFKIGDAILGWLESNSSNVQIEQDNSFSDYKSQYSENTLIFRVNANEFKLDTNWEFMFYKVPEISKNILYRVQSIDREYLGRDLMCYVLTLKSLNQELANTGRARQQNVMPNSPGQGYYDVYVTDRYEDIEGKQEGIDFKYFYNRYLVADKTKMFNNPAKKVVVKSFGLCGFSNVAFWGRKVSAGGDFRDFGIPRWIFPINLSPPSTYTLYRTQSEQPNYYWTLGCTPTIQFKSELFSQMKSIFDFGVFFPSQGLLVFDKENTLKTNPSNEGAYRYQLYGRITNSGGTDTFEPWLLTIPSKQVETDTIYGCAQRYQVGGQKAIHDAMFDAFWTQKNIVCLPITSMNTLNFGWTIGSAYAAGVANNWLTAGVMILIGLTGKVIQKRAAPKFTTFSCLIPSSLMDFMIAEAEGTFPQLLDAKNYVKLDYFLGDVDNPTNRLYNTETINTSFEADLTDLIVIENGTQRLVETTCIGQTTFANGNNIMNNGKPLLMDGSARLQRINEEDVGFIIDGFNIQALFKGDYSVEFLDKQDTVIWSGVFQSQGKWTNSIREINTWINTSIYGRENMFLAEPLKWPKTPAELDLIGLPTKPLHLQFSPFVTGGKKSTGVMNRNHKVTEALQTMNITLANMVGSDAIFNTNGVLNFKGTIDIRSWSGSLQDFLDRYSDFTVEVSTLANLVSKPNINATPFKRVFNIVNLQETNTATVEFNERNINSRDRATHNLIRTVSCSRPPYPIGAPETCTTSYSSGFYSSIIERVTLKTRFKVENQRLKMDYEINCDSITFTSFNNEGGKYSFGHTSTTSTIEPDNNYAFGYCITRLDINAKIK